MYEIPMGFSGECLLNRWDYPSNSDLLMSMLINEGVYVSLQSYYELVRGNDLSARGASFTSKTSLGITSQKRILTERLERLDQSSLDQLSMGNIFTAGPPLEDSDTYLSS